MTALTLAILALVGTFAAPVPALGPAPGTGAPPSFDPCVPEALHGVGGTCRARNGLPAALRWYNEAPSVDPDLSDAYHDMARGYALQGKKDLREEPACRALLKARP